MARDLTLRQLPEPAGLQSLISFVPALDEEATGNMNGMDHDTSQGFLAKRRFDQRNP